MNTNNSLGKTILELVGGEANIQSITHCATRLRMLLKDSDLAKANTAQLKDLDGVIDVMESGGQFQVIIGPKVEKVYDDLLAGTKLNTADATTSETKNGNLFSVFLDVVAGIFTPLLPLLAGSGVLRGLVLLAVQLNWLSSTSGTYHILTAASSAVFYFLPVLLAMTSAEKFKVNKYVAAAIMGALIMPEFTDMMGSHGNGIITHFFGLPIVMMNYTSTVIPAILAIFCLSYLERYLKKLIPDSLQLIFVPLISLFVMVPITAGIFGPFGVYTGEGISQGITYLINMNGWVAGAIIGGAWNIFVVFGLQWAVTPVILQNISKFGSDRILPLTAAANFGMAGATLGTFIRTKDKKVKTFSISALLSILFAGITEPSIYGIGVKYKRPLVAAIIGGAVGGAFMGGMKVSGYAYAFGALTTLPAFVGATFGSYVIGLAICFVVACVATLVLGLDEKPVKQTKTDQLGNARHLANEAIQQPVSGLVADLAEANDPAFASGAMGQGMVITPSDDTVYAPFDGSVTMLFNTNHAIGITSNQGAEVMIHVGIDTVKLNGKFFEPLVKQGDTVTMGQPVIKFDLAAIKAAGYDPSTFVIVTNTNDYQDVSLTAVGDGAHGQAALTVAI
ncbi:beta-glucoside-specific PTS transporter subunit IIABC [Lactiplantibacillus herbarum]|uniref:beta-glucoside-specific PTS transporter subunit IIABC n=1 Tax=Lactiplantibacillus herbarum TaxID=1670446 RepID=UPI00064E54C9|nr:beta-glucoside-specific PTS transporter subunit IIABC [Lactiplantibacillus herbarum]